MQKKTEDKIHHQFLIKKLSKVGIEGEGHQLDKEHLQKSYSYYLMMKNLAFLLRSTKGKNSPLITFNILIVCVCVLNHFSHVQLYATLWTVAPQALLSMGILQARILE